LKGEEDPEAQTNFTVEILSFKPLEIRELPFKKYIKSVNVKGDFDPLKPGGSSLSPQFVNNPQYALHLPEPS